MMTENRHRRLTQQVKSTLRPFIPKPWNSPVMEFQHGIWLGVSALYAENGRQLGEASARPHSLNDYREAEQHQCKYDGSRHGRLINISALRTAMSYFDKALEIVGAVRHYHAQKTSISSSQPFPIWDLYILARASVALISFQVRHRSGNTPTRDPIISSALASQYQFISGVFMICRSMMERGHHAIKSNNIVTMDEMYAYADSHDVFISPNGMACAASTNKIKEFLTYCIQGPSETPNLTHQNVCEILEPLVFSIEDWYLYALRSIELDCYIAIEVLTHQETLQQNPDHKIEAIRHIYLGLKQYCNTILDMNTELHTDSFEIGALKRQNDILELLNQAPLKTLSEKLITTRIGI